MVKRHFAWFNIETGAWIGEWLGAVPAPVIPPTVIGDARLMLLNEWTQQTQRGITPFASAYETTAQAWDLAAWDDCPTGGAVCLDVTMYSWPVGDFYWTVFDSVDQRIDFPEVRAYLELTPSTAMLDASVHSPRLVRSTPQKLIADVTGTPLEPWVDQLHGRLVRRDGRIMFDPFHPGLPEAIILAVTDRNDDLKMLKAVEPSLIPLKEGVLV